MHKIYLLPHAGFRTEPPAIDPIVSEFFHGMELPRLGTTRPPRAWPRNPVHVQKNTYWMPQVFMPGGSLVATPALAAELDKLCVCRLRSVVFEDCYSYPFSVTDCRVLDDHEVMSPQGLAPTIAAIAARHPSRPPDLEYQSILMARYCDMDPPPSDIRTIQVKGLLKEGVYPREVGLSAQAVESHGVIHENGVVLCAERVVEVLKPYLLFPWFWLGRVESNDELLTVELQSELLLPPP